MLKEITLEEAEVLALKTDYAVFAVGEEINTADAGAFFLEGYEYAMKQERTETVPDNVEVLVWYKKNEIFDFLITHDYSEEIANELSEKWASDLQSSFKKGFDKGYHEGLKLSPSVELKFIATRFAHDCRLNGCTTNNETCNLWDRLNKKP